MAKKDDQPQDQEVPPANLGPTVATLDTKDELLPEEEENLPDMPDPDNPELIEDPQIKSLTAAEADELEDATFMKEEEGIPDWGKPAEDAVTAAKPYWVGCLPGCPQQNPIVGGIGFPLSTQRVGPSGHGTLTSRSDQKGAIAYLTDGQVKKIMHGARSLVVRKKGRGKLARRIVLNADPAHFVSDKTRPGMKVREYFRQPGDLPMGCFIYMVPFTNDLGPNYQHGWPEPLVPLPPGEQGK